MNETDKAWAAGFFDGEGCILAGRNGTKFHLRAKVAQNDRRPLDRLRDWYGGTVWHEINPRQDRFVWTVTGPKARAFLVSVLPYLCVKQSRANLALSLSPAELHAIPNRSVQVVTGE